MHHMVKTNAMLAIFLVLVLFFNWTLATQGVSATFIDSTGVSTTSSSSSSVSGRACKTNANIIDSRRERTRRILRLCGGAIVADETDPLSTSIMTPSEPVVPPAASPLDETCSVIVSTSIGSSFLDKKKRLNLNRNSTVAELKVMVQEKFPGGPPVQVITLLEVT